MLRILGVTALAVFAASAASADELAGSMAYWGAPSADGGKCCASLAQVRDNIDRIDRALTALLAERQQYVAEAGRFKKDPAAVSAPGRVEAVVARVRADAQAAGLDPAVAEKTFRAMIAAFEDYERADWVRRQPAATPAK